MHTFGLKIKELRLKLALPLRKVAAYLDIDQAILSKIENGKRSANRELVIKLALYFQVEKKDLLVAWLSDNLLEELKNEEYALNALKMAEYKIIQRNEN